MKRLTMTDAAGWLVLAGFFAAPAALADSVFTIEDPPVDFQVVDADDGSGEYFYDGIGDFGPYSTYADVLVGTIGEIRSMAEFDISAFSIPPGEEISSATLQVVIDAIEIYGLGVNGETPESLAVDGYVGDGVAEVSDFQIADGNFLDSVPTPDPYIGQLLTFDVTSWVIEVVDAGETYLGLTARAESFGGLWITEGDGYPKLTIETESACPADFDGDGDVDTADLLFLLGAWGTPDGDVDGDGDTDTADLLDLLAAWGQCP
jgi:hypothetical protein